MIIVPEVIFMELFKQLPPIVDSKGSFKPVYHFGDGKELNKFIVSAKKPVFPLIYQTSMEWSPNPKRQETTGRVEMFIATETKTALYNTERWATSYQNILLPTLNNVHTALIKAGTFASEWDYEITNFPNYGLPEETRESNRTLKIIDAIRFRLDITISKQCINKNIKF
jgi:hypothetical protein